jgi:hypothetical protein
MNGFEDAMMLLRVVSDPETHKARLQELQATIETADARKAAADTAHAELETKLDVERDRLAKLEKSLRAREVELFSSERRHETLLNEMLRWKRERSHARLIQHMGGLTSEPDTTPVEPDPVTDRFAEPMDLGAIATHAAPKAARVSMRRPRA